MNHIFSQIFPPIHDLPKAVNSPRLREKILEELFLTLYGIRNV